MRLHLDCDGHPLRERTVLVEPEWVRLNQAADLWLDAAQSEETFGYVEGVPGHMLDKVRAQTLRHALDVYRGDLPEGWFQDWCLRERLRHMYLAILDKVVDDCEARGEHEAGLTHASRILSCDGTREHTHRRSMRLCYLVADHTAHWACLMAPKLNA